MKAKFNASENQVWKDEPCMDVVLKIITSSFRWL